MIRILLADDHPLIRTGLRTVIEQEEDLAVVGEASTGVETIQLCKELCPDILLLDLGMPSSYPTTTVSILKENYPGIKIIMLTAYDDEEIIRKLVGQRISGYILKDEAPKTLVRAVRAAYQGDTWFSRRVIDILASPPCEAASENCGPLTERETEVLHLLAKGHSNSQIADSLVIAEGTVKNHLVNIYQKLNVRSRAEAISWALRSRSVQ